MPLRILVVDDEKANRSILAQRLNSAGHLAEAHESPVSALKAIDGANWDIVLTDLCMPNMDGMEFMKELKARSPETSVILMTAFGNVQSAVEAMRAGASDYITKPFSFDELVIRLNNLAEVRAINTEVVTLRKAVGSSLLFCGMVGSSPQMRRIFDLINRFADNPSNILIEGETGTGKEQVAHALHMRSANAKGPFVAVGCANVPRELAESELFGHEIGAFTGATRRRKGRVEMAQGGTLFLDDVDDLPIELQGKLLRVIQEHKFERVGGEQTLTADVRFISASKVNLETLVSQGKFRDDLMYRLRVLVLALPPLRERKDDIHLLAMHFLSALAIQRNVPAMALSQGALDCLLGHSWPGNVRELRHAMEYAVAMANGNEIQPGDLPPTLKSVTEHLQSPFCVPLETSEKIDMRLYVDKFEQALMQWALKKANGHQGNAAELLSIPRTTLQSKLRLSTGKAADSSATNHANVEISAEKPALAEV